MACELGTAVANQIPLVALKVLTVAIGFYIVYLGWRAYRAERRPPVLWLTIGMAILTVSAISEAAAYQGLCWGLDQSHFAEGAVTFVGFLVLLYSLYVK